MRVLVNGEAMDVPEGVSVDGLLEHLSERDSRPSAQPGDHPCQYALASQGRRRVEIVIPW